MSSLSETRWLDPQADQAVRGSGCAECLHDFLVVRLIVVTVTEGSRRSEPPGPSNGPDLARWR